MLVEFVGFDSLISASNEMHNQSSTENPQYQIATNQNSSEGTVSPKFGANGETNRFTDQKNSNEFSQYNNLIGY